MIAPGVLAQQALLAMGGASPLPGPEQDVQWVAGSYLNQTESANSRSLIMPSTVAVGDLMITTVYHNGIVTPPSGWSLYYRMTNGAQFASVYIKTAGEADIGATLTWAQNVSGNFTVHYSVFRGAQPLRIVSSFSFKGTAAETAISMPQVLPANRGQYLLDLFTRTSPTLAYPATASFSSGWDLKTVSESAIAPIRKVVAVRRAMNNGDQEASVTLTPENASPSWNALQLLIGYADTVVATRPQPRGASFFTANAADMAVRLPAGWEPGDLLVLTVSTSDSTTLSMPGWSAWGFTSGSGVRLYAFTRVAQAGDDTAFAISAGSRRAGCVVAFRGGTYDETAPFASLASGTGSSVTPGTPASTVDVAAGQHYILQVAGAGTSVAIEPMTYPFTDINSRVGALSTVSIATWHMISGGIFDGGLAPAASFRINASMSWASRALMVRGKP